jgi:pimeloyl-ACP methyl ester carboxylesterase
MAELTTDKSAHEGPVPDFGARPPCPAPADFAHELSIYDRRAAVGCWHGPRYRMTYRALGDGPALLVVPGIASTYRIYALLLNRLGERFRTVLYDYPGEQGGDQATLSRIAHEHLADDLAGLMDHLRLKRAFVAGLSFGSTVVLSALSRHPRRFARAAIQGGFSRRRIAPPERLALGLARLMSGTTNRLPLRRTVLTYNSKSEFPAIIADRFPFYLEQNGLTQIRALAHRVGLLVHLNLGPILPRISSEILLIQGNEDRIVPRSAFDHLKSTLPRAQSVILPTVGHHPHLTHGELLARLIGDWFLPCPSTGCGDEHHCQFDCPQPPRLP